MKQGRLKFGMKQVKDELVNELAKVVVVANSGPQVAPGLTDENGVPACVWSEQHGPHYQLCKEIFHFQYNTGSVRR